MLFKLKVSHKLYCKIIKKTAETIKNSGVHKTQMHVKRNRLVQVPNSILFKTQCDFYVHSPQCDFYVHSRLDGGSKRKILPSSNMDLRSFSVCFEDDLHHIDDTKADLFLN